MNETTVLYALSTVAQTCAALAAFVGAVGIFRLQRLFDELGRLEASLSATHYELMGHDPSTIARSITKVVAWFHRARDSAPPDTRNPLLADGLATVDAWHATRAQVQRARAALIAFEVWNLGAIGASLVGFNHVQTLASYGRLTTGLLWFLVIGTVALTLGCLVVWTEDRRS